MADTKAVYGVEEKKLDGWLIVILIFLGWFGIDKFYVVKAWKGAWKYALVKFLYTCIGLGVLWNLFDIIKAFQKKYQIDFREYFR